MKKAIVDANIILGYLIRNERLFEEAISSYDELVIPSLVVLEVVYVMEKQYGVKRDVIANILVKIFQEKKIECERVLLINCLFRFRDNPRLSFADCYLKELSADLKCDVLTMDKQLGK
jgi:predicted nucleic acid-binding protein